MANYQLVTLQYEKKLQRFQLSVSETKSNSTSAPFIKFFNPQFEQEQVNYYMQLIENLTTEVQGIGTVSSITAIYTAATSFGISRNYQNPVLINFLMK